MIFKSQIRSATIIQSIAGIQTYYVMDRSSNVHYLQDITIFLLFIPFNSLVAISVRYFFTRKQQWKEMPAMKKLMTLHADLVQTTVLCHETDRRTAQLCGASIACKIIFTVDYLNRNTNRITPKSRATRHAYTIALQRFKFKKFSLWCLLYTNFKHIFQSDHCKGVVGSAIKPL